MNDPLAYFGEMLDHCWDFVEAARKQGQPIVGILCEFTPREVIMAAGGVPVCLCGGSAATIPAAEQQLPANLCPLIKSTFGYHVQRANPFLEMADLVVAETTCDGKKKMFELMGATRPMHVLELPHGSETPEALAFWIAEVRKLAARLEKCFGIPITDARLRDAIRLMNRERALRRRLAELMAEGHPPLSGRELLELKSIISGIPADLEQYETAWNWFRQRNQQDRPNHKARIMLTGVPLVHGAERVIEVIEQCGGLVVCQENCTGLKPILEDVDAEAPDPLEAIARKYFLLPCSVQTPNHERMESLRTLARQYRPQAVIELVWHACLTYDIESHRIRSFVESELRLPYLKINTDYSPGDSSRIATRVEALLETVASAH